MTTLKPKLWCVLQWDICLKNKQLLRLLGPQRRFSVWGIVLGGPGLCLCLRPVFTPALVSKHELDWLGAAVYADEAVFSGWRRRELWGEHSSLLRPEEVQWRPVQTQGTPSAPFYPENNQKHNISQNLSKKLDISVKKNTVLLS